ncbi:tripartite tricarboxylate transporter substrate-binding protein [Sabulicella rubraurantiaca]|uniref:tripartite tricarboxylate transporter substrate-binding protein n=1 Tax=Sabulicella rubraurantiaca TaxID=2811429 RepID=UPI001A96C4BC|nr:tripartite tricarboxylate transporter substrate-binding protein [Sabulicella rubraurantiaca]
MPLLARRAALQAALALPALGAQAQGRWPQRPVRLVVPYAPGGGTDVFARALAEGLRPVLGQTVTVENRSGGNGVVGNEFVARAERDGSVFLVDTGSFSLNPHVVPNLSFSPLRDFTHVSLLSRFPLMMTVANNQPFGDVRSLVAAAKAAPRSIGFGTSDAAISLAGNLFARLAGVEMVEVTYRGAAPMLNDLIAGHLPVGWNSTVAALPHIQAGRLRAFGVTMAERSALLPEVPTLQEAGVPGYEFAGWYAMAAPAGLDPAIAEAMWSAIQAALQEPNIRQRLAAIGADLKPLGPAGFTALLREEDARWQQFRRDGLLGRAG